MGIILLLPSCVYKLIYVVLIMTKVPEGEEKAVHYSVRCMHYPFKQLHYLFSSMTYMVKDLGKPGITRAFAKLLCIASGKIRWGSKAYIIANLLNGKV